MEAGMDKQKRLVGSFRAGGFTLALACLLGTQAVAQSSPGLFAYVGSFTTALNAHGDGIHIYRVDPGSGLWTHVQHIGDLTNPSFFALSSDHGRREPSSAVMPEATLPPTRIAVRTGPSSRRMASAAMGPT